MVESNSILTAIVSGKNVRNFLNNVNTFNTFYTK